ncbi:MAG TPA: trimethylamine methyltransferase family protein [Anaerolineae bacterium]|nr:trimethylamine methyltransferase family protein [Anaerolineae bacterium]
MTRIRINDRSFAGAQYGRLSPEQCQRLHNASLEILSRTGARLHDQEAIDLLAKAGASVSDGNRVRIPAGLVEKAFSTVPKRVTLYNRNGESPLFLEDGNVYHGPGSDCLNIIDHRNGERRTAVLQDVVDGITVCDALSHIRFVMSMFLPSDVNAMVSDRYQMEVMFSFTTKPIVFVTNEFSGCVDAVEMAEVVAGSAEALKLRPSAACYINVTSGLIHNEEALQKLLFLAGKGLPALYIPVVAGGINGPVTPAGSMALANAGVLVGLVLSQLRREGAPFVVPGWGGEGLDMRTMVSPYCAPDPKGMAHALAHHYNLPQFGLGGASESKLVDQQAAADAALTLMAETLGGANLIHDLGYLESGLCGSLAQLVICNEMVRWIEHLFAPVEITDETLALDLIDEMGPEGQFLDADHTMKHFRERWYPDVFERGNYEQWQARGSKTLAERASERVTKILQEHQPEMLPKDVARDVHAVVERAEAQFG